MVIASSLILGLATAAGVHTYQSISDTSRDTGQITIDLQDKVLVYPAALTLIEPCPDNRAGCFQSTRMSFCAPTQPDVDAGHWNCGGSNLFFRLHGKVRLRMLGEEIETLQISGDGVSYFFSPQRGLVMFRFDAQGVAEAYWASDALGFAADPAAGPLDPSGDPSSSPIAPPADQQIDHE